MYCTSVTLLKGYLRKEINGDFPIRKCLCLDGDLTSQK